MHEKKSCRETSTGTLAHIQAARHNALTSERSMPASSVRNLSGGSSMIFSASARELPSHSKRKELADAHRWRNSYKGTHPTATKASCGESGSTTAEFASIPTSLSEKKSSTSLVVSLWLKLRHRRRIACPAGDDSVSVSSLPFGAASSAPLPLSLAEGIPVLI